MAVVKPTVEMTGTQVVLVTWTALLNGDTGSPVEYLNFADATVAVEGTFGTGGSCTFQGSLDSTNYYALTDPQGNAITKTAAGIELVTEAPRLYRPSVTAGDGTTSIQVRLLLRRGAR